MNHLDTFTIDSTNSDEEYLYVDVEGLGTVTIKAQEEGIIVNIYPFHAVGEAVSSTWAHINDLFHPDIIEEVNYGNQNSSGVNSNYTRTRKSTGGTE